MKASYLGLSGLTHLAIVGAICLAAFEAVNISTPPRMISDSPVIDIVGTGGNPGSAGEKSSGPVIRTPVVKIPHYDIPTAAERAAALEEATVPVAPAKPVKTAPPSNGPRMTQEQFNAQHPPRNAGQVSTGARTGGPTAANGTAASASPGKPTPGATGNGTTAGESFEQQVCRHIRGALESYKAGRDDLTVVIAFVVNANGRLSAASVQKASGDDAFDQASLTAVTQVRVGPVPKEFVGEFLAVTINSKD